MKSLFITVVASLTLFAAGMFAVYQTPAPERSGAKYVLRIASDDKVAERLQPADNLQTSATDIRQPAIEAAPNGQSDVSPAGEREQAMRDDNLPGGASPWDATLDGNGQRGASDVQSAPEEQGGDKQGDGTLAASRAMENDAPQSKPPAYDDRFSFPSQQSPFDAPSPQRGAPQDLALAPSPPGLAENPQSPAPPPQDPIPSPSAQDAADAPGPRSQPPIDQWRPSTTAQAPAAPMPIPPVPRKRAQSQPPIPRDASSSLPQPVSEVKTAIGEQRNAGEGSILFTATTATAIPKEGAPSIAGRQPGSGARIAIIVRDLGLDERDTYSAINSLKPEVTLSFSPYGRDVKGWALRAKQSGHEVFLGVPMEPVNIEVADAAPNMLLASLSPDENMKRLDWVLGQIEGYQGVINMMGGKLAQSPDAIRPFMQTVKARGIAYVDDGAAAHPYAIMLAAQLNVRYRVVDGKVGTQPSPSNIQRELQKLEEIAQKNGTALAVANADAETLRQLVVWSAGLSSKGIVLVPASQIVGAVKL